MHHNPKVSVIIPVYNYGSKLSNAVQSVRRQDYDNVEIIIVNDNSSDDTEQIAHSLIDKNTRYIKNPRNLGVYASVNKGYAVASGEFCCQLDADDELPAESIKARVVYLQQNNVAAVHGGCNVNHNGHIDYIGPIDTTDSNNIIVFLSDGDKSKGINNASFMYRKSVFTGIGYLDESSTYFPHNDYEYALRTLLHCTVGVIGRALYTYNRHAKSHSDIFGATSIGAKNYDKLIKHYLRLFTHALN